MILNQFMIFFTEIKYYFFGSVAFKVNAKNPAGINPVVSNNLNLIPKSAMCATNCGSKDIPIPKESGRNKLTEIVCFILQVNQHF